MSTRQAKRKAERLAAKKAPRFRSTHNLAFFSTGNIPNSGGLDMRDFRIGTCEGRYLFASNYLGILAIINTQPGNGHFQDVLEWFAQSARNNALPELRIMEVWNPRFRAHLIDKLGFAPVPGKPNDVALAV